MQASGLQESACRLATMRPALAPSTFNQTADDGACASTADAGLSGGDGKPDYTNMTPRQFSQAAQSLYDRGELDRDGLFQMQFASGGIFKHSLSASTHVGYAAAAGASAPAKDYVKLFRDKLAFLSHMDGADDPRSVYRTVKTVLGVISD